MVTLFAVGGTPVACTPPSDPALYAEAQEATTYEDAWAACARIVDTRTASDCRQSTAKRFARFDGCAEIGVETWREECHFSEAEHLARTNERPAAMKACAATRYAKNCQSHVLDGLAMEHHARTVPEAAEELAPLVPLLAAEQVASEFWAGYFRIRIDRGLPVDTEGCPDRWCEAGARRAIWAVVAPMRRDSAGGPPPSFPWATSDSASREIARAWNEPPPGAPPPGGAPPGPPGGPGNPAKGRVPVPMVPTVPESPSAPIEPAEQTE